MCPLSKISEDVISIVYQFDQAINPLVSISHLVLFLSL